MVRSMGPVSEIEMVRQNVQKFIGAHGVAKILVIWVGLIIREQKFVKLLPRVLLLSLLTLQNLSTVISVGE